MRTLLTFRTIQGAFIYHFDPRPSTDFNLDRVGFSLGGMSLTRSKCFRENGEPGNTTEIKFKGTCDHVTLLPVILAIGQILAPIVVLLGSESKYRK